RLWWTMWSTGLCKVCFLRSNDVRAEGSIGYFGLDAGIQLITPNVCLADKAAVRTQAPNDDI
ncbi:hypothetical protein, partial [Ruegeria sp. HKCCD5851]|uniref:hypothetical protein n=1 Tax=Ruegeria sp. HKCCD5851 TaxID=2683008 RepID=UPI001C0F8CB8